MEAQELKDRIIEAKSNKIAELKAKARVSERNKYYEEALKYYQAVLKIDPSDREAKEGMDRVNILILEAKKKAELEKEKLLGEEIVPVLYDVANSKILARTAGFFAIASWNPFLAIGYLIVLLISSTLSLTYLAVVGEIALFVVIIRLSSRIRSVFITVLLFFLASLGLGLAINAR